MATYGYWTLADSLFDATVLGKENWKFSLELPQCGGLPATMPDFYAMAPSPLERRTRQLPAGSALRVALHMTFDEKTGFELCADEEEARLSELALAQRINAGSGQEPFVVRVKVFEKMTGALGVYILSAPYQGLRGVVRRVNLPGRLPAEQHSFAQQAVIGQEFLARLESVTSERYAQWQAALSLRNVPQEERLPAVSVPVSVPAVDLAVRRFRPLGDKPVEAIVVERAGNICRLVFRPRPEQSHSQMVLNLRWQGLQGVSRKERQERFASLVKGNRLMVVPEIFQSKSTGLELRALEKPALVGALGASLAKANEHLLLTATVTRVYKRKAQVTVVSQEGIGLTGWVEVNGTMPHCGETICARVLGVQNSATGRPRLVLSDRLIPADATSARSWRLVAA